jgi:hypothetical protein
MDLLRESVYHDQDGIVTFGLREFTYKVCGDYLPPLIWDSIGHECANWASREGFGSVAGFTALNICRNISGNAWPPVVASNEL